MLLEIVLQILEKIYAKINRYTYLVFFKFNLLSKKHLSKVVISPIF